MACLVETDPVFLKKKLFKKNVDKVSIFTIPLLYTVGTEALFEQMNPYPL